MQYTEMKRVDPDSGYYVQRRTLRCPPSKSTMKCDSRHHAR